MCLGVPYAMSGTGMAYSAIALHVYYAMSGGVPTSMAMSGTGIAYGAIYATRCPVKPYRSALVLCDPQYWHTICLRPCYAMSGTDVGYIATRLQQRLYRLASSVPNATAKSVMQTKPLGAVTSVVRANPSICRNCEIKHETPQSPYELYQENGLFWFDFGVVQNSAVSLWLSYAMSGTKIGYDATSLCDVRH
eukprot:3941223-Rhodomonas_salina.3